jgi:hypothetical protein
MGDYGDGHGCGTCRWSEAISGWTAGYRCAWHSEALSRRGFAPLVLVRDGERCARYAPDAEYFYEKHGVYPSGASSLQLCAKCAIPQM